MTDDDDFRLFVREMRGALLLVACFYIMTLEMRMQDRVLLWMHFPESSSGQGPPWDFIRRDFAAGVCATGALVLSWCIAAIGWKRFRRWAEMVVWIPWLFYGGDIIRAFVIYRTCPDFFDAQAATSPWPTYQAYLADAAIKQAGTIGFWIGMLLMIIVLLLDWVNAKREKTRSIPDA